MTKLVFTLAALLLANGPAAFAAEPLGLKTGVAAGMGCVVLGGSFAAAAARDHDPNLKSAAGVGCGFGAFVLGGVAAGFEVSDAEATESDLKAEEPASDHD